MPVSSSYAPPPPRAMKREPAFALRSLSQIPDAPLLVEDAATPAATAELKPARRFTRSLLKNKPGVEESAHGDSPPSVKKMEVACLTKHPGNIRELLNTGLLEGMPVMYIIPHSKKPVLKGVITGCNIRCFCPSCNGSKAVSAYHFEQHAGSTKKHPAEYIYLGNGNSLRNVLRASERSPLESLEKTIRSSIDPVAKKSRFDCLNCNEHVLPSSQNEHVLCPRCLESKQPQDPPTPSYPYKSNSSLTPCSKEALLKKVSSSKKGGSAGKVTNNDNGLHKLVFNVLLDGTEVAYYVDGQRKVDGYIKDQSIYYNHCNKVVSPSAFEAHAGEGSRRKPYDNIFTSNGVSLHELAMKISKDVGRSERETDDLCRECGHGGDIFPCKICRRSFHPACVGLPEAPLEWYCDNCRNLVQKEKAVAENKNAKAAGRQVGVESIEQIMKRAIRIVTISDDLGGCAICKKKDFNNAVFDERTAILCDQCEKEYHVGCLQSQWQVELKELPEGEWFCCSSCFETRSSLDKIISDGAQLLADPDIEIIRNKHEARGLCLDSSTDIKWQLISGKRASEDGKILLSAAVPIFHQSFDPIIEVNTHRDLIPEMVHGRGPKDGMAGQDYSGMYCALLTVGSTVVSAALLRVMGGDVAELPLVATSRDVQGLGYFQALFSCVMRVLISLKVNHFMLPAAHEAEGIWMKKFGFSQIPPEELEAHLNGTHLTMFQGTSYLYKAVPLPSSQEEEKYKAVPLPSPYGSKDAPFDLALLLEKPQRRSTRSLLKTTVDSTSDSPPSVKKMEMKMSKKVGPVAKKSCVNCLNCNEHLSSQNEHVLCGLCLESNQPQDCPTPSYPCKSNSSFSPCSKETLLKMSSSKKGGSAGKVTNKLAHYKRDVGEKWDSSAETLFCECFVELLKDAKRLEDAERLEGKNKFDLIAEDILEKSGRNFSPRQISDKYYKFKALYNAYMVPPKQRSNIYWERMQRGDAKFRKLRNGEPPPYFELLKIIFESRESIQKASDLMSMKSAQSVSAKKHRDPSDAAKKSTLDANGENGSVAPLPLSGADNKHKDEAAVLREQIDELQKKFLENEMRSVNEMNAAYATIDELRRQVAEKEALIRSTNSQLHDAKIMLADKQASLEKLERDNSNMEFEISSLMSFFEKTSQNVSDDWYDGSMPSSYELEALELTSEIDKIEVDKIEQEMITYAEALAAARENPDEEHLNLAAEARSRLQALVL